MDHFITTNELAKIAYTAYNNTVGGKAYNGDPLPDWNTFVNDPNKQKQVQAWRAAAIAVWHEAGLGVKEDLED